jgi:hypothetical protein
MALRLRPTLSVASSLFFFACTTSEQGFGDGMTTEVDLHVDAMPAPEVDVAADRAADAPADRAPDASPDGPADAHLAPDLPPDLAPDLPPPVDLANGLTCGAGTWCKSGFCVDGVCCDKACTNGCMACAQPRTGMPAGTCAAARDLDGRPCGKACGVADARPAVVGKVCVAGVCVLPPNPVAVERCVSDDPCVSMFCDDLSGRCIATGCAAGSCCCAAPAGTRSCMKQEMCTTPRSCAP